MRDANNVRAKAVKLILDEYERRDIDRLSRQQVYVDIRQALDFFNADFPVSRKVLIARQLDDIEEGIGRSNVIISKFEERDEEGNVDPVYDWITLKIYNSARLRKQRCMDLRNELIKHLPDDDTDMEDKRSIETIIIPSQHSEKVIKALESGQNFDFGTIEVIDWEEIESYAEEAN